MSKPDWCPQDVWDEAHDVAVQVLTEYGEQIKTMRPLIARALLEAHQRGMEEKEREVAALLKNPAAVRVNYLRGGIACQPLIDEAHQRGRREGMEEAAEMSDAWKRPSTVKLAAGEMTAQELRTTIAVAGGISSTIRAKAREVNL